MQNNTATPLNAHAGRRLQQRRNLDAKYFQSRRSVRTASVLVHTSASRGLDDEEIDQN